MNLSDPKQLASVLEAVLLAAGKVLSIEQMLGLFEAHEAPSSTVVREALSVLQRACQKRSYELKEVAGGYRLQIRQQHALYVSRLWEERPPRYSRAMLETLALIAYRQPITRGEIEDVRGVAVNSQIVRTLMERGWVRVVGHREVPGRPALLATTKSFLDHFGLRTLAELPTLAELRDLTVEPELEDMDDDDRPIPAHLQAMADAALQGDEALGDQVAGDLPEPKELGFQKLLAELDSMEQGLTLEFKDLVLPDEVEAPSDDTA